MSLSKEIFGIERKELDVSIEGVPSFNDALDLIDQFEISEEELAKIITSEYYPCDERATLLAKQIIKNQSKIFVRKNK